MTESYPELILLRVRFGRQEVWLNWLRRARKLGSSEFYSQNKGSGFYPEVQYHLFNNISSNFLLLFIEGYSFDFNNFTFKNSE